MSANTLHDLFYKVMNEYGAIYDEVYANNKFTNSFSDLISDNIPEEISKFPEIDKNIYKVEGKYAIGRWAAVPYIGIFDIRITTSPKRGVYIVYLINKDKKEMTLAFGIATTQGSGMDSSKDPAAVASASKKLSADKIANLKAKCAEIREKIGSSTHLIYDEANNCGAEGYDASCIYNKKYTLDSLPDDIQLKADLLDFLAVYKIYYDIYVGGVTEVNPNVLDHWPSGARDTTEFPKVSVEISTVMRDHLKAFTQMDGVSWNDYDAMNVSSGSSMTGSRLRTYRKMYEKFGLIMKQDDKLKLSRLGRQMATLESELNEKKEELLTKLRSSAIDILSRYQLKNPLDTDPLPEDCDVLPSVCIWRAMRELDNKLHPEEVNRAILRVMKMENLDGAIASIKASRDLLNGKYEGRSEEELQELLGEPVHTEQIQARIAPWFSFIGWGGLIIEQNVDGNGYRNLVESAIPLVDNILNNPPSYYKAKDEEDWLAYYIGKDEETKKPEVEIVKDSVDKLPKRIPREENRWPLNQILFGAPGTGKTYSTAEYANAIVEKREVALKKFSKNDREKLMDKYQEHVENGQIKFTTFHQSYGYEDFVQGIRPTLEMGKVGFERKDGVFKTIADKALAHPENNYVIIIDEINRANISRVFGELITLIEDDKRWGEINQLCVTLPMDNRPFAVPNNLYIIGTMNSADKSISLIDTALRRRFAFIEMPPNENYVENEDLKTVMTKLNQYLKNELRSTDLLIGHAYFIGKAEKDLPDIMNSSLIPLLYEYFYDDANKVEKALSCINDTNCEIDPDALGRVKIRKKKDKQ